MNCVGGEEESPPLAAPGVSYVFFGQLLMNGAFQRLPQGGGAVQLRGARRVQRGVGMWELGRRIFGILSCFFCGFAFHSGLLAL